MVLLVLQRFTDRKGGGSDWRAVDVIVGGILLRSACQWSSDSMLTKEFWSNWGVSVEGRYFVGSTSFAIMPCRSLVSWDFLGCWIMSFKSAQILPPSAGLP